MGEIELASSARESASGVALATVVRTYRRTIHKRKSKSDCELEVYIITIRMDVMDLSN